ncbi:hypothetical protein B0H13DRAFT_1604002, partial [Mycena leptocephala]
LHRYASRAARFISAYAHELTGADLACVNKKYHGHRVLPPAILAEITTSTYIYRVYIYCVPNLHLFVWAQNLVVEVSDRGNCPWESII